MMLPLHRTSWSGWLNEWSELDGRLSGVVWSTMFISLAAAATIQRRSTVLTFIITAIVRCICSIGIEPTLVIVGVFNVSLVHCLHCVFVCRLLVFFISFQAVCATIYCILNVVFVQSFGCNFLLWTWPLTPSKDLASNTKDLTYKAKVMTSKGKTQGPVASKLSSRLFVIKNSSVCLLCLLSCSLDYVCRTRCPTACCWLWAWWVTAVHSPSVGIASSLTSTSSIMLAMSLSASSDSVFTSSSIVYL